MPVKSVLPSSAALQSLFVRSARPIQPIPARVAPRRAVNGSHPSVLSRAHPLGSRLVEQRGQRGQARRHTRTHCIAAMRGTAHAACNTRADSRCSSCWLHPSRSLSCVALRTHLPVARHSASVVCITGLRSIYICVLRAMVATSSDGRQTYLTSSTLRAIIICSHYAAAASGREYQRQPSTQMTSWPTTAEMCSRLQRAYCPCSLSAVPQLFVHAMVLSLPQPALRATA